MQDHDLKSSYFSEALVRWGMSLLIRQWGHPEKQPLSVGSLLKQRPFGAGLFPMRALEKDFIGYVVTNSAPIMAPYGGRERILGNNPLSFAFPTVQYPPIVLDMSISVVSAGKLILCRKKGEKIPLGWAYDKNGIPTEDPYEGYEGGGFLAAIGEYKGY
jgi:LDH2 family malate/lactate/ureidoglycolate dehydrogenase